MKEKQEKYANAQGPARTAAQRKYANGLHWTLEDGLFVEFQQNSRELMMAAFDKDWSYTKVVL